MGPMLSQQCESHVKSEIETSTVAIRMLVPGAGTQEYCAKNKYGLGVESGVEFCLYSVWDAY